MVCLSIRMGARASHITSLTIVYSADYSGADKKKHQRSASLAFVLGFPHTMASKAENVSIWWLHHTHSKRCHSANHVHVCHDVLCGARLPKTSRFVIFSCRSNKTILPNLYGSDNCDIYRKNFVDMNVSIWQLHIRFNHINAILVRHIMHCSVMKPTWLMPTIY